MYSLPPPKYMSDLKRCSQETIKIHVVTNKCQIPDPSSRNRKDKTLPNLGPNKIKTLVFGSLQTNIGGVAPPWWGGVLPYKSLMGMCRWMGWHFHDWIDYNGVAFSIELLEWGHTFKDFWG